MRTGIALICFALSIMALLFGVVTEYRQSREEGPVALVPTLPWALEGAILIVLGLFWLPTPIPWWAYVVAFLGSALTFGCVIGTASRGRKTLRKKQDG
jgi:hypothetical protein